jgi:hypothetical protein
MIATITIITQDENKIMPNEIPRKKIGRMRMQFYERFKFNEHKGEAQHNKNYGSAIITTLPKKWIRDHKQHISDTTIHYDTKIKPIFRTRVVPLNKPSWLPILYLTHQEKNYLQNLQHQFRHHGKLLPKEKEKLNDYNECVAKVKLDNLCANYFVKQKRHQVEEQGISTVVT